MAIFLHDSIVPLDEETMLANAAHLENKHKIVHKIKHTQITERGEMRRE